MLRRLRRHHRQARPVHLLGTPEVIPTESHAFDGLAMMRLQALQRLPLVMRHRHPLHPRHEAGPQTGHRIDAVQK